MIKLKNLLKESSPGFENRQVGDALPTLDSVRTAYQAKKSLEEGDTFTAISKDSGQVSVFKTKDARDSAIKSGTHDKQDSKSAKGGDSPNDKKDVPKVNIFNKDKKDKKGKPTSKPSNSFSGNDIDTALEDSTQLDDFLDDNKSKFSKKDFFNLKDYKKSIQQLEGDIVDAEMDDDTEQQEKYESELEGEISKVKDILDKYKTTSSKKDTSQKSNTSNDAVKNFLSNKGEHELGDFRKLGSSLKDKFTPKQEKEYNNLLNALGKANYDEVPSDIKNAKDGLYDFIASTGETKSEPTKDSTQQRAGNTEVNKSVRNQAKKLGITPAKLGKEEYQKAMVGAAYEALTDSNFSTEARQLLAVITGDEKLAEKPDYPSMSDEDFDTKIAQIRKDREAGDVYTTPENDKASELGQHSSSESSWSGADAIDAIAFDLKMNGYKDLAAKIQSVIKED